MPPPYKSRRIESALASKGFQRHDKHHKMMVLHVNGKKTQIHTRISHSDPEYSGDILSQMRKQLGRLSPQQFDDLVECPMDGPTYLKLLRETGKVAK